MRRSKNTLYYKILFVFIYLVLLTISNAHTQTVINESVDIEGAEPCCLPNNPTTVNYNPLPFGSNPGYPPNTGLTRPHRPIVNITASCEGDVWH